MSEIITSPDFDRIRLGNDRATEDAVRLLWLMVNDLSARLRRVGGGSSEPDEHDLLSTIHTDTIPADPVAGAIILGGGAASEQDNSKFWGDGESLVPLLTTEPTGGVKFWSDGGAFEGISEFSGTFWQRLSPPTVPGAVLTAGATGVSWELVPPSTSTPAPSEFVGASVYRTSTVLIPALTMTPISWESEEFDEGGIWTSAAPTRLTAPSDGIYQVIAHTSWYYGTDEAVILEVLKNSAGAYDNSKVIAHATRLGDLTATDGYTPDAYETHKVARYIELEAGDYLEAMVMLRYSGSPEEMVGGLGYTYFQLVKVG